jgi:hypothetical protein
MSFIYIPYSNALLGKLLTIVTYALSFVKDRGTRNEQMEEGRSPPAWKREE